MMISHHAQRSLGDYGVIVQRRVRLLARDQRSVGAVAPIDECFTHDTQPGAFGPLQELTSGETNERD